MDPNLIRHLKQISPALDPHGKWLYPANAKTASKSIGKALKLNFLLPHRGKWNFSIFWNVVIVPQIDDVFKFTFVRNPWDRVLSAFFFLKDTKGEIGSMWSFKDYVKNVLAVKGSSVNYHFRPQSLTFLYNGQPFDIFIGRFENLQQDWAYVAEKIGAPKELPIVNITKHGHYTDYYDFQAVEIVRDIYKEEIDALGYKYGEN